MKGSLRYKVCLWIVWVQFALIPIVYLMMWAIDGTPYIWRWNLLSWAILTGYLIGFIALPLSRGLDKLKLLKWWLWIDFVATILLFIPSISRSSCQRLILFLKEVSIFYLQQVEGWQSRHLG